MVSKQTIWQACHLTSEGPFVKDHLLRNLLLLFRNMERLIIEEQIKDQRPQKRWPFSKLYRRLMAVLMVVQGKAWA